jgi:hypothetical protein
MSAKVNPAERAKLLERVLSTMHRFERLPMERNRRRGSRRPTKAHPTVPAPAVARGPHPQNQNTGDSV